MNNGKTPRIVVVVTAAGSSARMGDSSARPVVKKEYRVLPGATGENGRPLTVLGAAVSAFARVPAVSKIVVTVPSDRDNAEDEARAALPDGLPDILFVRGGKSRRKSVYNALRFLRASGERYDIVLIHDGARPWVSTSLINAVINATLVYGAAIPVIPVVETPKILKNTSSGPNFIARHPCRQTVVLAQTPQGFMFGPFVKAHKKTAEAIKTAKTTKTTIKDPEFTDDAEVWAFAWPAEKIATVPGETANKKITFPEDLASC